MLNGYLKLPILKLFLRTTDEGKSKIELKFWWYSKPLGDMFSS